jgi:DNA-binding MarR family transcriptional regulator
MENTDSVLVALRRVIRATDLQSKYLAKNTGLTAPQIMILKTVNEKPDATVGAIAADISLSQATVTTIIDRLEKRGQLQRQRSLADRRKVLVRLTEQGMESLQAAPTPLQEHFVQQFGALKEWEQNMIIPSLQRVAEMMDAQDIEAAPMLDTGENIV